VTAQELSVIVDWVFLGGTAAVFIYVFASIIIFEVRCRARFKRWEAELAEFRQLMSEGKRDEAEVLKLRILQRMERL
jgi:hypothetical protein